MIPFPQYVIFYNGIDPFPSGEDYMELHLSDAFIGARISSRITNTVNHAWSAPQEFITLITDTIKN